MISNWFNSFLGNIKDYKSSSYSSATKANDNDRKLNQFKPQLRELEDRTVPSTFYVDPTFTGPPGRIVTFNPGLPSQVTGLIIKTNAFNSIGAATAAASPGDTIELAAKTFSWTPQTTFNKTLNIVGSGEGATILSPSASVGTTTGDASAFLLVMAETAGTTVNFSNLTINGLAGTYDIGQGIRYDAGATGTITNVAFQNIAFEGSGNPFLGFGVIAIGANLTINNSSFTNIGEIGAYFVNASTGTVSNSTFTGKGASSLNIDYGVEASLGSNVTITGNTFSNMLGTDTFGDTSAGVEVTDPGTVVNITGNTFQSNFDGIFSGLATTDTPTIDVHFNNFIGNTNAAIDNNSASTIQAQNNFFGSPSGPNYPLQNPGGTGDSIINLATGITNIQNPSNPSAIQILRNQTPLGAGSTTSSYLAASATPQLYAVAPGAGGGPEVQIYQNGVDINNFYAYDPSFSGGVRTAIGNLSGTGMPELVTAPGPTGGPNIKVFNPYTGQLLLSFYAYDPSFTGGVYVAVGDVFGNGYDDIITGAGYGGGPNVKVFDGKTGQLVLSFYAYDSAFTGGVTVASADVFGTSYDDIITGAGPGGGPNVKVFDRFANVLQSYYAFASTFTGGVTVTAGDIFGTFNPYVIVNAMGSTAVVAFNGSGQAVASIVLPSNTPSSNSTNPTDATTYHISTADLNGSGKAALFASSGPFSNPTLRVFDFTTTGNTGTLLNSFPNLFGFDIPGGVFVG